MRPPRLRALLALAAVTLAQAAAAQEDTEAIRQVVRVVRWGGVFSSLFVVAGAWALLRVLRNSVERLGAQFAAHRLVFQKVGTILQFLVYFGAAGIVLALSLRLDEKVLALIGGTVAVALGFAMKDLVASFIAGLMIVIDRPFQVGDRVAFGGEYGDVVTIGLRSVRLRTLSDNIVTIPNSKFLSDMTSSGNFGELDMQVVIEFHIGLDQDLASARDVVREAALTSRFVHLPKPVVVLVQQTLSQGLVALKLVLKAYVLDTQHEKAFETDVTVRVLRAFQERGIQPPALLHRHVDAAGAAAPAGAVPP